ncbi:MAG: ATP-binding protein [Bacillota bacterium]
MTIRSRLLLFSVLLVVGAMVAAGIMGYQIGASSIECNISEKLTQIRTSKAQALQTEMENLGNSLLTMAEMSRVRDNMGLFFESEKELRHVAQAQSTNKLTAMIETYYSSGSQNDSAKVIAHLNPFALFLQSQFIQEAKKNEIPLKNVTGVQKYRDLSYFKLHENLHPFFLDYIQRTQLADILLVDKDGNIVYSALKDLSFGTNLNSGFFSGSRLGDIYRWSLTTSPRSYRFFDFTQATSFFREPVAYLAAPIFNKSVYLGTVVFQLPLSKFERILSDNHQWKKAGLGETGEVVAFGADGYMRTNSRLFFENPTEFDKVFSRTGNVDPIISKVRAANTTALQISLPTSLIRRYFHSEDLVESSSDYMGVPSLKSIGKINLPGGGIWVLVAKISSIETAAPFSHYLWLLFWGTLCVIIGVLLSSLIFARRLMSPLNSLQKGIKKLREGNTKTLEYNKSDEYEPLFHDYNLLVQDLEKNVKEKEVLLDIVESLNELLFVVEVRRSQDTLKRKMIVLSANHAAAEAVGLTAESLINSDLSAWLEGELEDIINSLEYSTHSDENFHEAYLKSITGEKIPLNLSWSRLKGSPETINLVVIGTDIRWKKKAERELKLQESLLKASQAISKMGSFRWDMNSGRLFWSDEQFNILGLDPLKTKPSFDLFRNLVLPEDLPLLDRALHDSQTNMNPINVDLRVRRADTNEYIWIRITGETEYDGYGNPVSTWGINQDITDLKKTEQDLIDAKNEALKSSQAKSQFLAHMSHEIRTPMNAIMGMAELLKETPLNEDQRYYLQIFHRAGEVLMSLINDILDLSKIEAGEVSLENIPFDLQKMMTDVQEMMRPKALEKGIEYSFDIANGISKSLLGDPTKLRQVLINLVSNSIKFTERGQIKVSVTKNPTKKDSLLISVNDSGIGISPKKQHLIFQKFSQADNSITRRYGGTGLGLAISKSLVELMGGTIWFKSRENVGTTFLFTIPYREYSYGLSLSKPMTFQGHDLNVVEDSEASSKLPQSAMPRDPHKKVRILLADDTEDNRVLFTHYLKNGPFEIIEAENGLEAVDKVKSQQFDIVFMDVQMPEMDGYAATSIIREWEKETHHSHIPIVALTAHALSDDMQKSLKAGCDDHVTKPFKKDILLGVINRYSH